MTQSLFNPLKFDFDFPPVSRIGTGFINKQRFISIKQPIKFSSCVFVLDLEFKILLLELNHENSVS